MEFYRFPDIRRKLVKGLSLRKDIDPDTPAAPEFIV
jgi:hypothetical protein